MGENVRSSRREEAQIEFTIFDLRFARPIEIRQPGKSYIANRKSKIVSLLTSAAAFYRSRRHRAEGDDVAEGRGRVASVTLAAQV